MISSCFILLSIATYSTRCQLYSKHAIYSAKETSSSIAIKGSLTNSMLLLFSSNIDCFQSKSVMLKNAGNMKLKFAQNLKIKLLFFFSTERWNKKRELIYSIIELACFCSFRCEFSYFTQSVGQPYNVFETLLKFSLHFENQWMICWEREAV